MVISRPLRRPYPSRAHALPAVRRYRRAPRTPRSWLGQGWADRRHVIRDGRFVCTRIALGNRDFTDGNPVFPQPTDRFISNLGKQPEIGDLGRLGSAGQHRVFAGLSEDSGVRDQISFLF